MGDEWELHDSEHGDWYCDERDGGESDGWVVFDGVSADASPRPTASNLNYTAGAVVPKTAWPPLLRTT